MKLRFEVDQAECMRQGIDCPKSIVTVEVNPKDLSQDDRNILADRMVGIDIMQISASLDGSEWMFKKSGSRIIAKAPTVEALIAAIKDDSQEKAKAKVIKEREENRRTMEALADFNERLQKSQKSQASIGE